MWKIICSLTGLVWGGFIGADVFACAMRDPFAGGGFAGLFIGAPVGGLIGLLVGFKLVSPVGPLASSPGSIPNTAASWGQLSFLYLVGLELGVHSLLDFRGSRFSPSADHGATIVVVVLAPALLTILIVAIRVAAGLRTARTIGGLALACLLVASVLAAAMEKHAKYERLADRILRRDCYSSQCNLGRWLSDPSVPIAERRSMVATIQGTGIARKQDPAGPSTRYFFLSPA